MPLIATRALGRKEFALIQQQVPSTIATILIPMKELPQLFKDPIQAANCCSSLSTELLSTLVAFLPRRPAMTLSIGSGTGLLETLLLRQCYDIHVQAVEVSENVNQYLPGELMNIVQGTWALCAVAGDAAAWIFVYPRKTSLLQQYLHEYEKTGFVRTIIWLGPRVDYAEHKEVLDQLGSVWTVEVVGDCGISPYEILAVWQKHPIETMLSFEMRSRS